MSSTNKRIWPLSDHSPSSSKVRSSRVSCDNRSILTTKHTFLWPKSFLWQADKGSYQWFIFCWPILAQGARGYEPRRTRGSAPYKTTTPAAPRSAAAACPARIAETISRMQSSIFRTQYSISRTQSKVIAQLTLLFFCVHTVLPNRFCKRLKTPARTERYWTIRICSWQLKTAITMRKKITTN